MVSPFLGGGSIELYCASQNITVYGSDAYEELINFWIQVKNDANGLHDIVMSYLPMTKKKFLGLRSSYWDCEDLIKRAAWFYILTRSSYGATGIVINSGSYKRDGIRRVYSNQTMNLLSNFNATNLHVAKLDYKDALNKHQNMFAYLDPPYYKTSKSYYGKDGDLHIEFDHIKLADILKTRDNWVLSYDSHPSIIDMYKDFEIIEVSWRYTMRPNFSENKNSELIIKNVKTNKLQF